MRTRWIDRFLFDSKFEDANKSLDLFDLAKTPEEIRRLVDSVKTARFLSIDDRYSNNEDGEGR